MNTNDTNFYPLKVPTNEYPEFSDRLKIAMRIRECSIDQLAQSTYLSRTAICGYRNGTRMPNLTILRLIAKHLDVSADFLIGLEEYIYY